jgi:hypothetical protein
VYDASYLPRVTFTDPQIASAGLTEMQARQQGIDVKVSTLPMNYVLFALTARDTRSLIKLVADTSTDKLLGAYPPPSMAMPTFFRNAFMVNSCKSKQVLLHRDVAR